MFELVYRKKDANCCYGEGKAYGQKKNAREQRTPVQDFTPQVESKVRADETEYKEAVLMEVDVNVALMQQLEAATQGMSIDYQASERITSNVLANSPGIAAVPGARVTVPVTGSQQQMSESLQRALTRDAQAREIIFQRNYMRTDVRSEYTRIIDVQLQEYNYAADPDLKDSFEELWREALRRACAFDLHIADINAHIRTQGWEQVDRYYGLGASETVRAVICAENYCCC